MTGFVYPEPGEVWEWDSTPPETVYVVEVTKKHSHGRMFRGISLGSGEIIDVFFRREPFNGWKRVA